VSQDVYHANSQHRHFGLEARKGRLPRGDIPQRTSSLETVVLTQPQGDMTRITGQQIHSEGGYDYVDSADGVDEDMFPCEPSADGLRRLSPRRQLLPEYRLEDVSLRTETRRSLNRTDAQASDSAQVGSESIPLLSQNETAEPNSMEGSGPDVMLVRRSSLAAFTGGSGRQVYDRQISVPGNFSEIIWSEFAPEYDIAGKFDLLPKSFTQGNSFIFPARDEYEEFERPREKAGGKSNEFKRNSDLLVPSQEIRMERQENESDRVKGNVEHNHESVITSGAPSTPPNQFGGHIFSILDVISPNDE